MRKNATILIMAVIIFSLAGWIIFLSQKLKLPDNQEFLQKKYPLLSKRIFASNHNDMIINFIPLRQTLREYIEKQDGKVGIYFEYLPSGTSIGINDREEIKLASLSKVPLVMSIYKKIEKGQMSQNDILVIKKEHLDQQFGNLWEKGEGTNLSVEELVKLSLIESDNTAYNVLFDQLTAREINEVYDGLDIQVTQDSEGNRTLASPKSYSSIFRSLYLSSFLSEENSSHILEILTQSLFNDKIPAGVAKNIPVSHKVGVFNQADVSQDVFIDCGIVYVPERPYILCAFVLDTDEKAREYIAHVSKMIYGYMVSVKGGN